MRQKNKNSFFLRTDRVLLAMCLIGLLLSAFPLLSDKVFERIFGSQKAEGHAPVVGEIAFTWKDVRYKSADNIAWVKAARAEKVRLGDSLFTGEGSQSQVRLGEGSRVDLDQNSLVRFSQINGIEVPNLALGNFRLAAKGTVQIAVANEIMEVRGDGSGAEVQIIVKENRPPRIRLLKGGATVRTQGKVSELKLNQLVSFIPPKPPPSKSQSAPRAPAEEAAPPEVFPDDIAAPLVYTDELYDHFELRGGHLTRREHRREISNAAVPVSWTIAGKPKRVTGQLAADEDFRNLVAVFDADASDLNAEFKTAVAGRNYFRLSVDGGTWSAPKALTVSPQTLAGPAPRLIFKTRLFTLGEGGKPGARIEGRAESARYNRFVLETSPDEKFRSSATQVAWLKGPAVRLKSTGPGPVYVRVRGVNGKMQLSRASQPARLEIVAPPPAPEPIVTEAPPPKEEVRDPAATEATSSIALPSPDLSDYLNRNYPSSKMAVEGAGFTMISQDNIEQGNRHPLAFMLGLRWMNWMGSNGVEVSAKTKTIDVQESEGGEVMPLQFEARYHRRWSIPLSPFSNLGRSQFSLLGGYEIYRNWGGGPFSPRYDLLKTGFTLSFPFLKRLDTGGEVLYGYGFDSSYKYEISGHIHYYLEPRWSLGVGYRIHLFEAGSARAAPNGIPYREGFGEGYSVIRWHY
jgi:hypothetical protein